VLGKGKRQRLSSSHAKEVRPYVCSALANSERAAGSVAAAEKVSAKDLGLPKAGPIF